MLVENVGHGTSSSWPTKHASFAPMKIVKSSVGAALGDVARRMMRSKSSLRRMEVYLGGRIYQHVQCGIVEGTGK
jgi:hypothetical protein